MTSASPNIMIQLLVSASLNVSGVAKSHLITPVLSWSSSTIILVMRKRQITQNLLGTDFPSVTLKSCVHYVHQRLCKMQLPQKLLHLNWVYTIPTILEYLKMSRSHSKLTGDSLIRAFKDSHIFTTLHILQDFIPQTQGLAELWISCQEFNSDNQIR